MTEEGFAPLEDKTKCQKWKRNWHQERALIGGIFLMINSGLHVSWSIFNGEFENQAWSEKASIFEVFFVQIGYFVGSIVGGFNAGFFVDSLGRRKVIGIGIAAQLIGSIITIFSARSVVALVFARVLSGYGHGTAYLALIIYASEIATKDNRGKCIALIHMSYVSGIVLFSLIVPFTVAEKQIEIVHLMGVLSGAFSLIALPLHHFFTYESPASLIKKGNDLEAQENIVKFRNAKYITNEIRADFQHLREMVMRDSRFVGSVWRLSPFYFILFLKMLGVIVFNYPLNVTRINLAKATITSLGDYPFQPLLLSVIRFLFSLVIVFVIDGTGRKRSLSWSIRTSFVAMLILAIGYVASSQTIPIIFNFAFEVFSSMGTLMTIDVYSGEAFNMAKKGIGLSLANCIENFFQIVLLLVGIGFGITYVCSSAVLFIAAAYLLIFVFVNLPETRKVPLPDVTSKFTGISFKFCFCKK
ncbi:Sugar transporter ERD6-like 7 [Pseudolycoriella hygida]|uniref:Sugar transporter ERD6-like 7 n=1 Tax=Pseudolycoriella hygida TaxID=35572 RepID=A0A9Q0MS53_9DIPT|nr:Sugar transporter ERD6-like 7 [Pseudolycoriella hygida]